MLAMAPALAAAAVGGAVVTAQPASASGEGGWAQLRACESGGNYSTNTGNGFYGAYQFTASTWRSLGYGGLPNQASPATQDEAARRLLARSGAGQWPVCGRGLSSADAGSVSSAPSRATRSYTRQGLTSHAVAPASTHAVARNHGLPYKPSTSAFPTAFFTTALAGETRQDVRHWQQQMNKIGYKITVDGRYGSQSAAAAGHLQADKKLTVDQVVGPLSWLATFGLPR
jgi:peptidoglycan hydrolase-like protein with peptidoglycan-binding domain